jgi:hypothetical protein
MVTILVDRARRINDRSAKSRSFHLIDSAGTWISDAETSPASSFELEQEP